MDTQDLGNAIQVRHWRVYRSGVVIGSRGKQIHGTKTSKGYLQTTGPKKDKMLIHRIVAIAWVPNPHKKPHINHIDGNKTNNVPSNLEWVTPKENNAHARSTGLR